MRQKAVFLLGPTPCSTRPDLKALGARAEHFPVVARAIMNVWEVPPPQSPAALFLGRNNSASAAAVVLCGSRKASLLLFGGLHGNEGRKLLNEIEGA